MRGQSNGNWDLVHSLVCRSSDALAAAVAPYAQKEVEPLGYDFALSCNKSNVLVISGSSGCAGHKGSVSLGAIPKARAPFSSC